jgi:type IV secretion system protein VirB9
MKRILPILFVALAEMAQMSPPIPPSDPRIQLLSYDPGRVVTLRASTGYALVVELSDDERIENVVVGDSAGWQVTANKRGNHLIIKPLGDGAPTDLVVSTDSRRYVFVLQPAPSPDSAPFVVRFWYPQDQAMSGTMVAPSVASYRLRGDKSLFPASISDDGKRTTLKWAHDASLPAIFATDDQGKEAIVNGRMVDGSYVVEGISSRFVFRLGKAHATAIRHATKGAR